jgi:type II secretory pathway pseudopilin PulG
MTVVIVILVILVIAVLAAAILLLVVGGRWGRRSYQRYSGLERQRDSAKQARVAGSDRLKEAERHLVEAQRELVARSQTVEAQGIERLRTRLSTMADQHRHATYGYAPLGSPDPIRETELAEVQERDSETIGDADAIVELAADINTSAQRGEVPDLQPLAVALDRLRTSLERRMATS